MADWAAIRDAVQVEWATATGVGDVYNYRRYVTEAEDARAAMLNTIEGKQQIAFADIDLATAALSVNGWGEVDPNTWDVSADVVLMGRVIRSQKDADASGAAFGELLWKLFLGASRATARIVGTPSLAARQPVEIVANDHREFGFPGIGKAVCHYGEIHIRVQNTEAI